MYDYSGYTATPNPIYSGSITVEAKSQYSGSCSGELKAVFTWIPDFPGEPPPKSVIVTKSASAKGGGISSPDINPTGNAATGLGRSESGVVVPEYAYAGPGRPPQVVGKHTSIEIAETKYEVVTGKSSLEVTCNPSASGSGNRGAGAMVSFSATVSPVFISLDGTTPDFLNRPCLLAGQGISAYLTGAPAPFNHQWSVTGDVFKNFTVTTNSAGQAQGLGYKTDLTSAYLHDLTLSFFTLKREQIKVNCSANVVLPDGSISQVQAEKVFESFIPINITWRIVPGVVRFLPDPLSPSHVAYWEQGSTPAGNGEAWHVLMYTPDPFPQSTGNNGEMGFAQLAQSSVSKLKHISDVEDAEYGPSQPNGLDCGFPYLGFTSTLPQGDAGDGPAASLTDYYYVNRADNFQTWLIYQPPSKDGQPTTWVPLQRYTWSWSATVQLDPSGFWTMLQSANIGTSAQSTSAHPAWGNEANITDTFIRNFPRY